MGLFKRSIVFTGLAATGYGYYLSKQYESIPFYKLPKGMQINSIVNDYKANEQQYFAYCNTFSSVIKLDPKLIDKFSEKDLHNAILINFLNSKFYRFELTSFSRKDFTLSDLTNHEPQIAKKIVSGSLDKQEFEKIEELAKLVEILPRKKNNSLMLKINIPPAIQNAVGLLSSYGLPYRCNTSSYQEIFIDLQPEINEETRIVETYNANIYFANADLYEKNHYDGKILPRLFLSVYRFYNRLLLQSGSSNISEKLGLHQEA